MATKKRRRKIKSQLKPDDPLLLFINAIGYQVASQAIDAQPHRDILLWPQVVCEALCLELFIKCMRRVRRRKFKRNHDMLGLYMEIGREDRKIIEKYLDASVRAHPQYQQAISEGVQFDAESILKRASNMFVQGRYWHELILPGEDDCGHVGNIGVANLSDGVRNRILDLHPDWIDAVRGFRFRFPRNTRLSTSQAR